MTGMLILAAPLSGTMPAVCSSVPLGNCPLQTLHRQAGVESLLQLLRLKCRLPVLRNVDECVLSRLLYLGQHDECVCIV